jgi:translation initiation factor IF-3
MIMVLAPHRATKAAAAATVAANARPPREPREDDGAATPVAEATDTTAE